VEGCGGHHWKGAACVWIKYFFIPGVPRVARDTGDGQKKMDANKGDVCLKAFFDLLARDYLEAAVKNLRKAVKEGNLRAMYWLGKLYLNGWLGCQKSFKRALGMWHTSSSYGPSAIMLYRNTCNAPVPKPREDDILSIALWDRTYNHVMQLKNRFLEYYFLAAQFVGTEEEYLLLLGGGAAGGCTECLLALYNKNASTSWQRRRLWRHKPTLLFDENRIALSAQRMGYDYIDKFGCIENARHIICLLEWARKKRHSDALAVFPRDVLRIILKMLLKSALEEDNDGRLTWNHLPKKRRKIK
jgi:hypothetical protein